MRRGWTKDNAIHLISGGHTYFSEALRALDGAQREIIFITYIYRADSIGNKIAEHLKRASLRGVSVSLIVDGVGSMDLNQAFVDDLERSGIQVFVFRPFAKVFRLKKIFFRRLHQKLIVIDEHLAFVGGINVDESQLSYLDYAVSVQGPLAFRIHKFVTLFLCRLKNDWANYFKMRRKKLRNLGAPKGDMRAAFVIRDNFQYRRSIEHCYLQAIQESRHHVILANAYFLPGYRLRRAMIEAARRGVRVQLLLPGLTDHPLVRNASALLYRELLHGGVEITEYHRALLHAKVAVVDGHWVTVGSCNLDLFSLFLSLEANVIVDDSTIAKALEKSLLSAIEEGVSIPSAGALSRSPWEWFVSWLSLLAIRVLRFVSGV
jgi:cardiolipin synthase